MTITMAELNVVVRIIKRYFYPNELQLLPETGTMIDQPSYITIAKDLSSVISSSSPSLPSCFVKLSLQSILDSNFLWIQV